jgi:hypothetical protein
VRSDRLPDLRSESVAREQFMAMTGIRELMSFRISTSGLPWSWGRSRRHEFQGSTCPKRSPWNCTARSGMIWNRWRAVSETLHQVLVVLDQHDIVVPDPLDELVGPCPHGFGVECARTR